MKPPAVARAIVRACSDPEDRVFLLEDLAKRFHEIGRTEGPRAAKRWYWSQALSVVPCALRLLTDAVLRAGHRIQRRSWARVVGELRSGVRALWRSPLCSVGVAGTLGLGLAAATITFAAAWKVWLAPMPYPDPGRVVRLYELEPLGGATEAPAASDLAAESRRHQLSAALLEDLRAHSWRTIEAVSVLMMGRSRRTREGETPRVSGMTVSPDDGFEILGIVPTLGRLPSEMEREVLLSERFWRANFGADPDVVGSEVILNGLAFLVAGVARLPSGFPDDPDIFSVLEWSDERTRALRFLDAIARVRPGHSVAEAKAEMNAFLAKLGEIHPEHRGWSMDVVVLADDLIRPFRGVLALLLAAGTVFLLLAGVNVLGLVAARRVESRHDRSIRLALGASEGRLLRDSLVENLVLAGIASLAGVLSAYWLIGPIRALVPQHVPRLDDVAVTPPLVLGALAIGLSLGAIIGVTGYLVSRGAKPSVGRAPVWRAAGVGGRRLLVVGQVALTTLLTAAGVAILYRASTLRAIDLGFEPEGVSTTSTSLRDVPDRLWSTLLGSILNGLRARGIPAAVAYNTPMSGDEVPPFGVRANPASEEVFYQYYPVSAGYFSVMGIEVLAGRGFGPADHASSAVVVIVSEDFVDQYFPPGTGVKRIVGRIIGPIPFGIRSEGEGGPATVVGVVESTRHHGPDAPVMPDVYRPMSQHLIIPPQTLLVQGELAGVGEAVSDVVEQVDPDLRWTPLIPYTAHLKEWFAPLRLQIIMIGVLGTLGLLLASLGLYSLMAYQVATRRRELGIRKAVGAPDGRLMWGVLSSGVAMAAVGALLGMVAWYQLVPWTRELVDGIDSTGRIVPLSVALVVGGSSVFATLVPAVRAMRVDPLVTLKAE